MIGCDQIISLRFDSDEQLKINFTSSVNDYVEDWSAVIVEQLSFTAQEQTSVVLYQFRNKKTEEYKDYVLNDVIDYQFVNIQTMKTHLHQMLMIMVEIMTIVHNKALKHQINTLNIFQTNWLDQHAVILDADYTQALTQNIFHTVSVKDISGWTAELDLFNTQKHTLEHCHTIEFEISLLQESFDISKSYFIT